MNPERWAEIARAFAAERGDDEIISARRCTSHPRLGRCDATGDEEIRDLPPQKSLENLRQIQSTEIPQDLGESDPSSVIPILKGIIKEKVDVIDAQREKISLLNQELALLKAGKETSNFSTQTGKSGRESRNVLVDVERIENRNGNIIRNSEEDISQTEKSTGEHEKSKPLSEVILEKMEMMEKRMDALVSFIQSQFPKSTYPNFNLPFDKLTREGHPPAPGSTFPMKVWNKPPSLQPRASYGSVLRQAYSRSGSNNGKIRTRDGYNSTESMGTSGSKSRFHTCPKVNEDDRDGEGDAQQDPGIVEQRLQFVESLVAQLKRKFMRVLQIQKRNMDKGAKYKSVN